MIVLSASIAMMTKKKTRDIARNNPPRSSLSMMTYLLGPQQKPRSKRPASLSSTTPSDSKEAPYIVPA
jgi:hypothetical protein